MLQEKLDGDRVTSGRRFH